MRQLARGPLQRDRFAVFGDLVGFDLRPAPQVELQIAEMRDELEGGSKLLMHDVCPDSGSMQPGLSVQRLCDVHVLWGTAKLWAKWLGSVVGTLPPIHEGVFQLPTPMASGLEALRSKQGKIARRSRWAAQLVSIIEMVRNRFGKESARTLPSMITRAAPAASMGLLMASAWWVTWCCEGIGRFQAARPTAVFQLGNLSPFGQSTRVKQSC